MKILNIEIPPSQLKTQVFVLVETFLVYIVRDQANRIYIVNKEYVKDVTERDKRESGVFDTDGAGGSISDREDNTGTQEQLRA